MTVKLVEKIRSEMNVSHKILARLLGISLQAVRKMCGVTPTRRPQTGMDLTTLCKLRKASGKNWAQFGRVLDDEFLIED